MQLKGIAVFGLLLIGASARPTHAAETWALLVGVSKYQNPQIASLKFPAIDAASIRDALVDPQLGGLPADHVKLLTDDDATAANIQAAVTDFLAKNVQAGDHVLISLAGHGVAKGVGLDAKSFLLPTDVKGLSTTALETSAVDLKALSAQLGKLPASQFVLFVDACREDPTPGRGVKGNPLSDVLSRNVQVVPQDPSKASAVTFFACQVGQRAYEDPDFKHGVFTYWILDAIKQAAVPVKPDGAIDMGRLSSYVTDKVTAWAKKTSSAGDFEIEQTPEMVTSVLTAPVILMNVKRPLSDSPFPPAPPRLVIQTYPEGAQITVNGAKVSGGPVVETGAKPGENTLQVAAPGYAPFEHPITVLDGYAEEVVIHLQPEARAVGNPMGSKADDLYQRAQDAEVREQWEAATAGYQIVLQQDPTYTAAYERLATLQQRQGLLKESIDTLVSMLKQTSPSVHVYSLLTRAYAAFVARDVSAKQDDGGEKKKKGGGLFGGIKIGGGHNDSGDKDPGDFRAPKDGREAASFARKAADAAVMLDANAPEAQLALGFALIATDKKGQNKKDAMGAFGKAAFLDPKDATNNYGLGYGIRVFAVYEKDTDTRKDELNRAIASLKEALKIRPNYYEAHRELAYCYHLLDQPTDAHHEYDQANANRGSADDKDEVAGLNVALSSVLREEAQNAVGARKADDLAAASGYLEDAKELTPNLEAALRFLKTVGLGNNLTNYLDAPLQQLYDKIPSVPGVNIPGINIPGLHL